MSIFSKLNVNDQSEKKLTSVGIATNFPRNIQKDN